VWVPTPEFSYYFKDKNTKIDTTAQNQAQGHFSIDQLSTDISHDNCKLIDVFQNKGT